MNDWLYAHQLTGSAVKTLRTTNLLEILRPKTYIARTGVYLYITNHINNSTCVN